MMRTSIVALLLLALVALLSVASATSSVVEQKVAFEGFKARFGRTYSNAEEELYRFNVFVDNLKRVAYLNENDVGQPFGVSPHMDMTPTEFRHAFLMQRDWVPHTRAEKASRVLPLAQPVGDLPKAFDWRSKGVVTPVKNQGQCGSCWAFSTTEEIESMWLMANHTQVLLSEQQIVDCDTQYDGCGGGDTTGAYEYVIKAGGLDTEASYPYTAANGACSFKKDDVGAKISSWAWVTHDRDEDVMQKSMYANGPLSVCVDAATWQFYTGGVIHTFLCGHSLDHCVQITGWDAESDGTPYWIVRNSWGASWGHGGYLYVKKGDDICGIAQEPTLAIV